MDIRERQIPACIFSYLCVYLSVAGRCSHVKMFISDPAQNTWVEGWLLLKPLTSSSLGNPRVVNVLVCTSSVWPLNRHLNHGQCTACAAAHEGKRLTAHRLLSTENLHEGKRQEISKKVLVWPFPPICFWSPPQENDTVLSQPAISTTSTAPHPTWPLSSASLARRN